MIFMSALKRQATSKIILSIFCTFLTFLPTFSVVYNWNLSALQKSSKSSKCCKFPLEQLQIMVFMSALKCQATSRIILSVCCTFLTFLPTFLVELEIRSKQSEKIITSQEWPANHPFYPTYHFRFARQLAAVTKNANSQRPASKAHKSTMMPMFTYLRAQTSLIG